MEQIKSLPTMFLLLLIFTCIIGIFYSKNSSNSIIYLFSPPIKTKNSSIANISVQSDKSDVLLIYVYANTHKHAYGNLKYFIDTAVREKDSVDYIFILQQVENKPIDESKMPLLPKTNAFYIQHENHCFDFGTIGWFFAKYTIGNPWINGNSITNRNNNGTRIFNLTSYKYFILMNSSVRGPFFPPYFIHFMFDYQKEFNQPFHWYYVFTKRINNKVKLVGCTISCTEFIHVQSYFLTTDFIGLSALLKTGDTDGTHTVGVFACAATQSDTIRTSELGISKQIVESDYMVNSILTKYESLTFSRKSEYTCGVIGNPYTDKNVDGTSLEPYEVVFVKFNDKESTTDAQERAKLYQKWMNQAQTNNRTSW